MRNRSMVLGAAFLGILAAGLATGQPFPGGRGGPGGGTDPLSLIRNSQVQKELNLTEEQQAKIPEAVLKALENVLDKEQYTRLRQIELQQRGTRAFADAKIQTALKLTDDQKDKVKTILDEVSQEMKEMFGRGKKGDAKGFDKGAFERMSNLRKEANEKLAGVLTSQQKRAWKEMLGEEFKMERPSFGGFRGKGGFFKKKKVDEDK